MLQLLAQAHPTMTKHIPSYLYIYQAYIIQFSASTRIYKCMCTCFRSSFCFLHCYCCTHWILAIWLQQKFRADLRYHEYYCVDQPEKLLYYSPSSLPYLVCIMQILQFINLEQQALHTPSKYHKLLFSLSD